MSTLGSVNPRVGVRVGDPLDQAGKLGFAHCKAAHLPPAPEAKKRDHQIDQELERHLNLSLGERQRERVQHLKRTQVHIITPRAAQLADTPCWQPPPAFRNSPSPACMVAPNQELSTRWAHQLLLVDCFVVRPPLLLLPTKSLFLSDPHEQNMVQACQSSAAKGPLFAFLHAPSRQPPRSEMMMFL